MSLNKVTTALAALIALVGINVGNVQAAVTQPTSEKTPLVLEHGAAMHTPGASTAQGELSDHYSHYSHSSHESHSSHYSHYSSRY